MIAATSSLFRIISEPDMLFLDFSLACLARFFSRALSRWLPRAISLLRFAESGRWRLECCRDGTIEDRLFD